jgi:hypothetical protein
MKMEQIACSETSAYKIQKSGNYPEEIIQLFSSYNKRRQDSLLLSSIFVKNSTRFEQTYCPSSGVLIF